MRKGLDGTCREVCRLVTSVLRLAHSLVLLGLLGAFFDSASQAKEELIQTAAWQVSPQSTSNDAAQGSFTVKTAAANAARYPTLVRDLRSWSTAEGARLVLDLNHKVSFTETHLRNPDRVVIEIHNA